MSKKRNSPQKGGRKNRRKTKRVTFKRISNKRISKKRSRRRSSIQKGSQWGLFRKSSEQMGGNRLSGWGGV